MNYKLSWKNSNILIKNRLKALTYIKPKKVKIPKYQINRR